MFSFAEFERELISVRKLVTQFLVPTAPKVLEEFQAKLSRIRERPGAQHAWAIEPDRAVVTKTTDGLHEPGGGGVADLFAEISCIWEITPVVVAGKKGRQVKKDIPADHFLTSGLASTLIMLRRASEAEPVAMWRMEIGDRASPGAWLHTQLGVHWRDELPFPGSMPVPRLPCYMMTPLAVIEYVLGELFQDDWPRSLAANPAGLTEWSGIQTRRMMQTLAWQLKAVERPAQGTPLATLKAL
ncbi:MAG: hypothetical protein ACREF4_02325 [Gammaproteobacteria bacterium]